LFIFFNYKGLRMAFSRTVLLSSILVGGVAQGSIKEEIKPLLNQYIEQTAQEFAKIDDQDAAQKNDAQISEEERNEVLKGIRKLKQLRCRTMKNILLVRATKQADHAASLKKQARTAAKMGRAEAAMLEKSAEEENIKARIARDLAEAYQKNVYEMWRYKQVLVAPFTK